jgi:LysR family transcriptional regulator, chromosome initiation inhibitor
MKMTLEGQALHRYCLRAVELEGHSLSQIHGRAEDPNIEVTIAGPTSIVSSRILPNSLKLYELYPRLRLHFRLDDQEDRIDLLKKGQIQIAIVCPRDVCFMANESAPFRLKRPILAMPFNKIKTAL